MPPINIEKLKAWIEKQFGKKCKDFEFRCITCQWYRAFEHLNDLVCDYQDTESYIQKQMAKNIKKQK